MEEILFFDRYQIESELGQGAMGIIYRAHDLLLDRYVALKVVSNPQLGTTGKERLLAEAKAAARLNHPNIVSIFDAGEYDQKPFIVMELIEGDSLFDRKPQGWEEIIDCANQICAALDHAHEHGVVHRDLKPENVIRDKNGAVKLTDFGLARSGASRLSAEDSLIGTVFYIAPEAVQGKSVDGRADLYALGVMLYEWSTGILPFTADDPVAVISQHLFSPVIPPHVHNPKIPSGLESIILDLLAKTPQDRPASAMDVILNLKTINLEDRSGQTSDPGIHERLDGVARGKLVAREKELDEMTALWNRAAGGAGQVLLISGEPGIGKTRLGRELGVRAAVGGSTILTGECYAEGGMPYAPFLPMIRETLALNSSQSGINLPDYVLADLVKIVPGLSAHFPDLPANPVLDPDAEQQRVFDAVIAWASALCKRKPVFIFLDDIHWADSGTLFLMRHIARRIKNLGMMFVATYRETELNEATPFQTVLFDLTRERLSQRIKLTRLNREQTDGMLTALLNPAGVVDPQLVNAIFFETEGNPFFIEEVCKSLLEENRLKLVEGIWQTDDLEHLNIPQSVRTTIQSRLTHLPESTLDVLRLAAIFGREFDFQTLFEASGINEDALVEALEQAEKAQIIRELPLKRSTDGLVFAFGHALMPATLRESLSGLRRQRLHRKAAIALQKLRSDDFESLAYHFEEAGDAEKALQYYTAAADRAMGVYAYPEAQKYYEEAIEVCPDCALRYMLQSKLGEVLFRQTRYSEAIVVWRKAIEEAFTENDLDRVAFLYSRAARAAWYISPAKGLEICQEGMEKVPADLVNSGMASLLHEIARAYRFTNQSEKALPFARRALAMAENLNLVDVQADTLATIGILSNISQDEAHAALEKSAELSDKAGLLTIAGRAHLNLGSIYINMGRFKDSAIHIKKASEINHRIGIHAWEHTSLGGLANVYLMLGDLAQADEVIQEMDALLPFLTESFRERMFTQLFRALWFFYKGELQNADDLFKQTITEIRKSGNFTFFPAIINNYCELLFKLGRAEEAMSLLDESELIESDDPEPDVVSPHYLRGWAAIILNKPDDARKEIEILKNNHTADQAIFLPVVIDLLEMRLAGLESHWDDMIVLGKKLLASMEELGWRWRLAEGNLELADTYIKRAKTEDLEIACKHLEKAQAIFRDLNAPFYVAQSETMLQQIEKRIK